MQRLSFLCFTAPAPAPPGTGVPGLLCQAKTEQRGNARATAKVFLVLRTWATHRDHLWGQHRFKNTLIPSHRCAAPAPSPVKPLYFLQVSCFQPSPTLALHPLRTAHTVLPVPQPDHCPTQLLHIWRMLPAARNVFWLHTWGWGWAQ